MASLLSTAEAVVTEIPEEKPPMPGGGMGGMGRNGRHDVTPRTPRPSPTIVQEWNCCPW